MGTSRRFDLTKITQIDFDVNTGCVEGRDGCTGKWFALWLQPLSEDPSQYSKDHPHDNKYFGEIDLVECYNCDQSGHKPATNFDTCGDGSYSKEDCNQYTWDGFEAVGLKAHVTMYNDPESGSVLVRPCSQGAGSCPQDGDGGHINLAVTKQWDYRQYTMIADLWDMSDSGFYVEFGNITIQEA